MSRRLALVPGTSLWPLLRRCFGPGCPLRWRPGRRGATSAQKSSNLFYRRTISTRYPFTLFIFCPPFLGSAIYYVFLFTCYYRLGLWTCALRTTPSVHLGRCRHCWAQGFPSTIHFIIFLGVGGFLPGVRHVTNEARWCMSISIGCGKYVSAFLGRSFSNPSYRYVLSAQGVLT